MQMVLEVVMVVLVFGGGGGGGGFGVRGGEVVSVLEVVVVMMDLVF